MAHEKEHESVHAAEEILKQAREEQEAAKFYELRLQTSTAKSLYVRFANRFYPHAHMDKLLMKREPYPDADPQGMIADIVKQFEEGLGIDARQMPERVRRQFEEDISMRIRLPKEPDDNDTQTAVLLNPPQVDFLNSEIIKEFNSLSAMLAMDNDSNNALPEELRVYVSSNRNYQRKLLTHLNNSFIAAGAPPRPSFLQFQEQNPPLSQA